MGSNGYGPGNGYGDGGGPRHGDGPYPQGGVPGPYGGGHPGQPGPGVSGPGGYSALLDLGAPRGYGPGSGDTPASPTPPRTGATPWILGALGCVALLVVLAIVIVVGFVLVQRGGDEPDPTAGPGTSTVQTDPATTEPVTTEPVTSEVPSADTATWGAGEVPPPPAEVDGYFFQETKGEISTYLTGDASDAIGLSFRPGTDPSTFAGALEQPIEYRTWTCGITQGMASCVGGTHGGTAFIMSQGKSPAELATWGDALLAAWG